MSSSIRVLEPTTITALHLPPGQILQRSGDRVLFMGARIQKAPNREVTLVDLRERRVLWRAQAPGAAVRGILLENGDWILVATVEKGPAYLVRLDGETGAMLWQRRYAGPALDALWHGERWGLLVTDGNTLWQVRAEDGAQVRTLALNLGERSTPENTLLARDPNDPSRLYLASERLLLALRLTSESKAQVIWKFRSPKFIADLLSFQTVQGGTGIWVGAHSYAYWLDTKGRVQWRLENQDINYGAVALPTIKQTQWIVFGNFVKGLYGADAQGIQWHVPMPEGNLRVLGIPLPLPRHVLLGGISVRPIQEGDASGYWLAIRSLDAVFVFRFVPSQTPQWIAKAPITSNGTGSLTMLEKVNTAPNYPPLWWEQYLVWSTPQGLAWYPWPLR